VTLLAAEAVNFLLQDDFLTYHTFIQKEEERFPAWQHLALPHSNPVP
jgi:hypothetical protein